MLLLLAMAVLTLPMSLATDTLSAWHCSQFPAACCAHPSFQPRLESGC